MIGEAFTLVAMPRFGDPLLSARARRVTLLKCQEAWDRQVADAAGHTGNTNHHTAIVHGKNEEYVVLKGGLRSGTKLRYPPELEDELHRAQEWAKKRVEGAPKQD